MSVPEEIPYSDKVEIVRDEPDYSILRCSGCINVGEGQTALKTSIETIINSPDDPIYYMIIDLRKVTEMDSPGLGVLVNALRAIRERGGELCFIVDADPKQRVNQVLRVTGLDHIFTTHIDEAIAVEAIKEQYSKTGE